jgi:L-threonylcarbamoyladenylate synthase
MNPVRIVRAERDVERERGVEAAREALRSGGVVAVPTESFYGLSVDIGNEAAVRRLFEVKGRRPDRPVLLLLPSRESLDRYAPHVNSYARRLADRFWPGGLTLVFEADPGVSPLLTAGTGTIGLRFSSHPVPTLLAEAMGGAITGTSANRSGSAPCCTAGEVADSLGPDLALILDGGPTTGGAGSTVLDIMSYPPIVLREGMVSRRALAECLGVTPA